MNRKPAVAGNEWKLPFFFEISPHVAAPAAFAIVLYCTSVLYIRTIQYNKIALGEQHSTRVVFCACVYQK